MTFDMTQPRQVLAGTAYGECRGGGRIGMENVLAVVMTRYRTGWQVSPLAVCLARKQFSCWDDVNRAAIQIAYLRDPNTWNLALSIAGAALAGTLPDRTNGADSYFALSMTAPAYWARPPAEHVYFDAWHSFWRVRPVSVPNGSVLTADDLNAQQLARRAGA